MEARPEHSYDLMFKGLKKNSVDAGRRAKIDNYEEWKRPVDVYADARYFCLTALSKAVVVSLAVQALVFQDVSDA